ncbi:hypothetical protein BGX21_007604 [Mortierella sp. AD011]|nr:hypothetical protein BGX21_007604 [Mortierella sp. AD011]
MTTLAPFDLPLVMEQIGTHLGPKDLISCTLVCKDWHAQFAPFIWWYILEDCDELLNSIYHKHKGIKPQRIDRSYYYKNGKTSPMTVKPWKVPSADKPTFHLETEFIRIISEYIQKIDNLSSAFHKQRRTRLAYSSFLSFILMGWLCNDVREIKFVYHEPVSFGPPDMYEMSDQYFKTSEKPDRVVEILERSRHLEVLYLQDFSWSLVYRWISLTNTLVSVPQWPKLVFVTLAYCTISQDFLDTLLINSPSIQRLCLKGITFRSKTQFEIFDFQRKHEANDGGSNSKAPLENVHLGPPIRELVLKEVEGVTLRQQMLFASQLQNLEKFSFTIGKEDSSPALFLGSGFQALRSLVLTNNFIQSGQDTMGPSFAVVIRTAFRIEHLKISRASLTVPLYRAINGHCSTLTSLYLDHCNSTYASSDVLHHLLRSCSHLKTFSCLSGAKLYCEPQLFEQPWACTEIESLAILPDCIPRDDSYTPAEARSAFFRQLSCLINLRELGFAGGVGINRFVVEEGINLLAQHLVQLEILSIRSFGLETNANLTKGHAMVIENSWPKLKAIRGFYHMDREDFVAYMKEHRPEVKLSYT